MRILEITKDFSIKNHSYWNNAPYSGAPNKDSPHLDYAFKLVKYWDDIIDYYLDNEDELTPNWLFNEEAFIFDELASIGYQLYVGPRGKGVIDMKKNLMWQVDTIPYKPIDGIRSDF